MGNIFVEKVARIALRKAEAAVGRLVPVGPVLDAMVVRPYELHLELTNICNAKCIFCPYRFQQRPHGYMSDEIFFKAVDDFVRQGGGNVFFTPIVGDALIDEHFLERVKYVRAQPGIGGIKLVTNAILADRFGAAEIIRSGLTEMIISTAGFDEAMYERVYQNKKYKKMRRNVLALLDENRKAGQPVDITIGLRPDEPLSQVMKHPDFQEVLGFEPKLDFSWSYTNAGGLIRPEMLGKQMKLRVAPPKREACVNTINGPAVLLDGTVIICSCVAAMDAVDDLKIGDIREASLSEIWRSERARRIRQSFGRPDLNETCRKCEMYRDLELYRTRVGWKRAVHNLALASQPPTQAGPSGEVTSGPSVARVPIPA